MSIRALLPAAVASAALAAAAPAADVTVVYVFDHAFSINLPGEPIEHAVIRLGETVQWFWIHPLHDVRSSAGQDESFQSPIQGPGDTFEHTFTHLGEFAYYCSVHGFDDGNGGFVGMGGYVTVLCPADFNGDTVVDTLDFLAFLNAFVAGDESADFNGDTVIDTLDFLAFLNAFNTSCP